MVSPRALSAEGRPEEACANFKGCSGYCSTGEPEHGRESRLVIL